MTAVLADPRLYPRAALTVKCPKCPARLGEMCQSTGGGYFAYVTTHAARFARIEHWSEEVLEAADRLATAVGRQGWLNAPAGTFDDCETAALPILAKVKPSSPKGVRLSEAQAERIEWAAQAGGRYDVSTVHFHGDAADRASINALEEKGILRFAELVDHGYSRRLWLTAFGWQVYRQHRLIIRRLPDAEVDAFERRAIEAEAALAAPTPAPLVSLNPSNVVDLGSARLAKAGAR